MTSDIQFLENLVNNLSAAAAAQPCGSELKTSLLSSAYEINWLLVQALQDCKAKPVLPIDRPDARVWIKAAMAETIIKLERSMTDPSEDGDLPLYVWINVIAKLSNQLYALAPRS